MWDVKLYSLPLESHTRIDALNSSSMYFMNALLGYVMPYLAVIFNLVSSPTMDKRSGVDYYDPTGRGGSMLINAGDGYGEPMNVLFFHHRDALV